MPYDDEGFTPRTAQEIIEDYEDKAKDIFDVINFSPSSILWQQMKVHALDEYYYEILLETASEQMSILNAVGTWLDKHGIEAGIFRKGAQKAQGYVDCSVTLSGAPIGINEGAEFKSSLNSYLSDENDTIDYLINMVKTATGESYDFFPSDYPYAEEVVQVLTEVGGIIPPGLYTFDTTYHNNLHWLAASSGVIVINEEYFVEVTGQVTKKIEVTSVASGVISNAKIGEVTTSVTYPFLTVTNSAGISGGIDNESDDNYRTRLLDAQRRSFTLAKIKDISNGINGVRSTKVYQDKGVDVYSVADWDNPSLLPNVRFDQYPIKYSQGFVPGNLVLSLGRVTLRGRAINSPPPIRCGVRLGLVGTGVYLDIGTYEEADLDPNITGFQDIHIDLKYNGLDQVRGYNIDFWLKQPEDGITGIDFGANYWLIRETDEMLFGSDSRFDLLKSSGGVLVSQGSGVDLMFKTWYNGAAYTVIMAPEDGFGFENLKVELEDMLDYVDGGGLSPIGIQYMTLEASEINIDVKGIIYIEELADFATVRTDVVSNIENYLESLETGQKVVYAEVEYAIMRHPQVINQKNTYIKRADQSTWMQEDVAMLDDEIADLGSRNLQRGVG